MKRTFISFTMVVLLLTACVANKPSTNKTDRCSSTYVFKSYFHHSSIPGLYVRLMRNTPSRIQLVETGSSISMFYCNKDKKTEILLATYDIEQITSNHDNDIRPSVTTLYSETQVNDYSGSSTIRLVQKIRDFGSDFVNSVDKEYYLENNLENLPFVLSTPCSDTYINKSVDVYNFSRSLSAVLTITNPPSQIQLIEKLGNVQVFYCVFNETSDRTLLLGTITILDTVAVDYENSLSDTGSPLLYSIEKHNGFGIYFSSNYLPYVNASLFSTILHTGESTESLISGYKNTIYSNGQLLLKFKTEGLSMNNPY